MATCKRRGCTKEAWVKQHKGHTPMYCSIKCRNIHHVDVYRKKKKQELVDFLGGKCSRCGYDKCLAALEFHHIDPSQKDFHIAHDNIRSWERVKTEIEKCVLVCANCHAEIHYLEQQGIEVEW